MNELLKKAYAELTNEWKRYGELESDFIAFETLVDIGCVKMKIENKKKESSVVHCRHYFKKERGK